MKSFFHKHVRSTGITIFSVLFLAMPVVFVAAADAAITNPLVDIGIYCFLISMLQILVSILIPVVAITLVISGFMMVGARGNPAQLIFAKKFLLWSLVATALVLGVFGIISIAQGTINTIFPGYIVAPACPTANTPPSGGGGNTIPPVTPPDLGDPGGDTGGGSFPTVPTKINLSATAPDSSGVNLSYSPVKQTGKAIAKFKIAKMSVMGSATYETLDTSYTDSDVTPSTAYTYSVTALDSSGNVLAQSERVPVAVPAPTLGGDPARSQCLISVSAELPSTISDYHDTQYTVNGVVTSSGQCVGDISITSSLSNKIVKAKPNTTTNVSFTGINNDPYLVKLDGPVGTRGIYAYPGATIIATDECGNSNSVSVSSCSLTNTLEAPQLCPIPNDSWQSQLLAKSTSLGSNTSESGEIKSPTVGDIVPESVKLLFDDGYVVETQTDRKFTPSGNFSPYDDIKISLQLKTCANKPQTLPFGVVIATKDSKGADVLIPIQAFPFTLDQNTATSPTPTYNVTAVGWPDSLPVLDKDKETLIDSIANKRPLSFRILDDSGKSQDVSVPMTDCVHEYGEGDNRVVSMRGVSAALSPDDLIAKSADIRDNGFQIIDPFKTYFEQFSFYTDLAKYEDGLAIVTPIYSNTIPSCQPEPSVNYFYTNRTQNPGAESAFFSHQVNIQPDLQTIINSLSLKYPQFMATTFSPAMIAIHEAAHGFAGVMDEYAYDDPKTGATGGPSDFLAYMGSQRTINCVIDPTNAGAGYVYGGKLYGDKNIQDCSTILLQRPSQNSIMRHEVALPGSDKFNVISCGYIVAAINGTGVASGPSYWPECMKMDTIKPAVSP